MEETYAGDEEPGCRWTTYVTVGAEQPSAEHTTCAG